MPMGFVSFDRKVLPLKHSPLCITYPKADFWGESAVSLCHLEVCHSGLIEDQQCEALEVDFANKYIGGGALSRGCVQNQNKAQLLYNLCSEQASNPVQWACNSCMSTEIGAQAPETAAIHFPRNNCFFVPAPITSKSLGKFSDLESPGVAKEEIRFMINPESIVGMLFLPAMGNNEAVEIVGAERFSNYTG
ncbi:hypothetical protein GIB67_031795 [Kingdonia uniflora]|uniref:PARG catalytic Macro domain-containing protein n=1 Tax=Kingdonia uniflora TaxID=39325 RepID=A0A7J7L4G3_9MAGN|nr:hypothetical protein GIB67_031795 [Kingdonia uniflora]